MATTKIRINKAVTNKDGKHPVNLQINDRNNRMSIATGFWASEEEWEWRKEWKGGKEVLKETGRFKQGSGHHKSEVYCRTLDGNRPYTNKTANEELAAIEVKAQSIIKRFEADNVDWTLEMFKERYSAKRVSESFLQYANNKLEEYRSRGQSGTALILADALKDLSKFSNNLAKKDVKDINLKFVNDYINYCRARNDAPNTISIRLRSIRAVLNKAIKEGVGSVATYPFGDKCQIPKEKRTRINNFLPMELLAKISATPMDNPYKEEARHLFLFTFYAGGINYMDASKLTSKNVKWIPLDDGSSTQVITYRRSKTQELITVFVNEDVQRELDWFRDNCNLQKDYLTPIIGKEPSPDKRTEYVHQRRKRYNKQLQAIAKELGFGEAYLSIGSYTARHSFAMALRKAGIPDKIISEALGHQDQRTTKSYFAKFGAAEMLQATKINLPTE